MSPTKNAAVFATALKTLVVFTVLVAAPGAHATLIGTMAGGQLGGIQTTVGQQFISPAMVDGTAAPEFSGTVLDGNSNVLEVSVNILAESFVIDTHTSGLWGTRVNDGFMVMLTDLEWFGVAGMITDVALTDRLGDTDKWDLNNAQLISFDADSIGIQLVLTRQAAGRAAFEFGITATHTPIVAEPATAALMFFGLMGAAFRRRAAL
jgi:hypothetical protein